MQDKLHRLTYLHHHFSLRHWNIDHIVLHGAAAASMLQYHYHSYYRFTDMLFYTTGKPSAYSDTIILQIGILQDLFLDNVLHDSFALVCF